MLLGAFQDEIGPFIICECERSMDSTLAVLL